MFDKLKIISPGEVQSHNFCLDDTKSGFSCARVFAITSATSTQQKPIIDLVDKILAAKKADASADTSALERQIDAVVYELYGLSAEEIEAIEGK